MGHSHKEIYLHLVWATRQREPLLTPDVERRVHRCIQSEAERLGAIILAIGGLADHVHLVAQVPPHVSASQLAQQVKGVSSRFAIAQVVDKDGLLPFFG
ncbi:MAG: IS200/IS605 family transposase [Janthinobacterium lividum]